jgi:hypothetical protein
MVLNDAVESLHAAQKGGASWRLRQLWRKDLWLTVAQAPLDRQLGAAQDLLDRQLTVAQASMGR